MTLCIPEKKGVKYAKQDIQAHSEREKNLYILHNIQ